MNVKVKCKCKQCSGTGKYYSEDQIKFLKSYEGKRIPDQQIMFFVMQHEYDPRLSQLCTNCKGFGFIEKEVDLIDVVNAQIKKQMGIQ